MIREIDNALRIVALASVAAFVAAKLIDSNNDNDNSNTPDDGFQSEKFDDIW